MSNSEFIKKRGILVVKPFGAEITKNGLVKGKMKLFCKVRLGQGVLETSPDLKNGSKPIWSSSLDFVKRNEKEVRIEIHHKNRFTKSKYIGECSLPLEVMIYVAEIYGRCEIKNSESVTIGTLDLQIKWTPESGSHPSPISRISFFDNQNNIPNNMISPSIIPKLSNNPYFLTLQDSLTVINDRKVTHHHMSLPHHISLPGLNEGQSLQSILQNFNEEMKKRIELLESQFEEEDSSISEDERCVVCLGRKKAGVFYRCGHNCCCVQCGVSFIGSPCPICRELVFDFIKIFQA